jgi:gamma-D-glutamyl-L-lysine dipeptidyl-peptidase
MTGPVRLTHAVVSLPALDVRPEPRHAAELVSQLLMGETVRRLGRSRDGGWVRVRNDADGYSGWVRAWGLVPASAPRVARWRRRAGGRVSAPLSLVRAGRGTGGSVSPVFFGNRLIAGRASRGWCAVELPDGRRGFLPAAVLAAGRRPRLEARVASLLGAPYLWGGRTPAGYDCSAFVQQVLLEQGVSLPRDARDQWRASVRLADPARPRPGDLAFFRRPGEPASHVGLALGAGLYAHCRGRVAVASVDSGNVLCDKELLPQFMGWFRPARDEK